MSHFHDRKSTLFTFFCHMSRIVKVYMVLQALGSSLPSTSSYSSCNYFKNNEESLVNVFWGVDYNKINYPRA